MLLSKEHHPPQLCKKKKHCSGALPPEPFYRGVLLLYGLWRRACHGRAELRIKTQPRCSPWLTDSIKEEAWVLLRPEHRSPLTERHEMSVLFSRGVLFLNVTLIFTCFVL